MKTKAKYVDELIEAVQESIWEQEVELFARAEQIELVKQELEQITKGLEEGKFQDNHKEGLKLKDGKYDNLTYAQEQFDKQMKGLENQLDKMEFLKRYKAQLKDK